MRTHKNIYRESSLNKLRQDFKSQIAGIPGAVHNDDRESRAVSTRSSAVQRRHSADAPYGKHSLENKLAVGPPSQCKELDHMRSQFGGNLNFASQQRQLYSGNSQNANRDFHQLLRHSHHSRGHSEGVAGPVCGWKRGEGYYFAESRGGADQFRSSLNRFE